MRRLALLAFAAFLVPAPASGQAKSAEVAATAQFKFTPETITVAVGGSVTWTNDSDVFHTVTGGDKTADASSPVGNGTLDARGKTYKVTFAKAGTYPYFCQPHVSLGMTGTVVVGTAASASPSAKPSPSPAASASAAAPVEESENKTLAKIDAQREAEKSTLGGFRAFSAASTAALIALGIALFASTRARRGGR